MIDEKSSVVSAEQFMEFENKSKINFIEDLKFKLKKENDKILEAEKEELKNKYDIQFAVQKKKTDDIIDILNLFIKKFADARVDLDKNLEQNIIKIVLNCLRKIVGDLWSNEEVIILIIQQALLNYNIKEQFVLKVSPIDYKLFSGLICDTRLEYYKIDLQQDINLQQGECLIDLKFSIIDISPIKQIETIERLLDE